MRFNHVILLIIFITLQSCQSQTETMPKKHTNALIEETSPYLLQHAHNPVDWNAWNEASLKKAKNENKLILISIGYAACHWCHVMEHESFEDSSVAAVMNKNFINIKVDREERPDVDQVYMNAVQLMTGRGGWPLNIIALPDGRPIWGGTYFPKQQWMGSLNQLADLYESSPEKLVEYAEKLTTGMQQVSLVAKQDSDTPFTNDIIKTGLKNWKNNFDDDFGGMQSAPKFMMPNNYHFLLRYGHQNNDTKLLEYVNTTLTKMSYGGVYDHVGGGFSRYSVDEKWHVPHFEKMLYDNGQLVSLFPDAYLLTKNDWYKTVVEETLEFIKTDLTRENGSFYSSLDADSMTKDGELEEGAFYVWTEAELKFLLNEDFKYFTAYYNINDFGKWEDDNYVLIRNDDDASLAKSFNITINELQEKVTSWKEILLTERNKREAPRLDDKSLTSWNALMLQGYLDAYRVFGKEEYLDAAKKNADFILTKMLQNDGSLLHTYNNNEAKINGYLEDYALVTKAFISLYEQTLNNKWLDSAKDLTDYSITHFYDDDLGMFYFTSNLDDALVTREIEYRDNVIPASNSVMANNLFLLSHYFSNSNYKNISQQQLQNALPEAATYPGGYSNWLNLLLNYTEPFYEVVSVGKDAKEKLTALQKIYIPNKLIAGSTKSSNLPLFESRFVPGKTLIYVCQDNACKLPTENIADAKKLLD